MNSITETEADSTWIQHPGRYSFSAVRFIVVLLLLTASVSKLIRFVEVTSSDGLLSDPLQLRLVIAAEAALAAFILLAPSEWSRRLILLVFGAFIGFAVYAIATNRDCNCVAEFIPVRVMLFVDICVFGAAWLMNVGPSDARSSNLRVPIAAGVGLGVLFLAMAVQRNSTAAPPTVDGPVEYLLADSLVDQQWPLTGRHHPALTELNSGKWLVLIVRRDCDHCRELVSKVFKNPERHRADERTAVFIAGSDVWPFRFDLVATNIQSNTAVKWPNDEPFVASPAAFTLEDGVVTAAADSEATDAFLNDLF